jgi:Rieske Fe-S protein
MVQVGRRRLLRLGFWGALATTAAMAVSRTADFLYPVSPSVSGPVHVGHVSRFAPGSEPVLFKRSPQNPRAFWLVHVTPEKGGEGNLRGLLALASRCPHLHCDVPWRADARFAGKTGWFLCPCHGSTFAYNGDRVFGPAPTGLHTLQVEIDKSGNVIVHTRRETKGGDKPGENAARAVAV